MITAKEARQILPDVTNLKKEVLRQIDRDIKHAAENGFESIRFCIDPTLVRDLVIEDLKQLGYEINMPTSCSEIFNIKW